MYLQEEFEVAGGKGAKANFVWRCTFCKRESSAKFDSSYPTRAYTEEDSGQFAPLLKVECRGLEFVGFEPRDPWKAASPKGTKFDDIDLSEDMWTEYDEKAGAPVSISEFEWKWARA
ncbi:hypothetical protein VNI00_001670 [Paramarasmius palmivorus]|uniref:Uncharacterized protein n=1 Tax=Paramarasmius palmivorus TaxID=297713 RepID=A0AAW0E4Q9_9AGAR